MRRMTWLPGVALSAATHVAVFGGLVALLPRDTALPPLVVDLAELAPPAAPPGPGGERSGPAGASRRLPREAGRAAGARPPAARPAPALPSVPAPDPRPVPPAPSGAPAVPPVALVPATDPGPAPIGTPETNGRAPASGGARGLVGAGADGAARDGAPGAGAGDGTGAGRGGGGGGAGSGGPGTLARGTPGGEGTGHTEYGAYLATLRQRIQEALEYPPTARRRGLSGTVHVEIVVTARGTVGQVSLLRSSSHAVLDEAALAAVRRVGPVPFPPALPPRALTVRLPVVFQLDAP